MLASLILAASAVAFIPQNSIADDGTQSLQSGANQLSVAASDTAVEADNIQAISDEATPAGDSNEAPTITELPAEDAASEEASATKDDSDAPQGEETPTD